MIDIKKRDEEAIYNLKELFGTKIDTLLNCHILQRLKGISFLGVTSLLYKKEDSNRFSHSVSVSILASKITEKLSLNEQDKNILILYYLFHDIGHLPNSHVSEPLLRLLQAKRKFHASLGLYLFDSDENAKQWIYSNIKDGELVWEGIRNIFSNNIQNINPQIYEIIKSPLNPDSVEGIFRTAYILDINYILPEKLIDGIYIKGENIYYPNANLKLAVDFFKIQKKIYDNYVFGIANQSAEAMWKKALLIVMGSNSIDSVETIFELTDEMLVEKMLSFPISKELIENINNGKCLTPYWVNNQPSLMSNKYAEISNSIYSNHFAVSSIEEKIYNSIPELTDSMFVALHFNRLRQFELLRQSEFLNQEPILFDNGDYDILFSGIPKYISIKKTQGIIPLSVFSYPFIEKEKIQDIGYSYSQKIIDNILIKSFEETEELSSYKAIIVTTPLSPNDTNLPAGPLVLKSYAKNQGINIALADLNIKYINQFDGEFNLIPIGDHCKNTKIKTAQDKFFTSIEYPNISDKIVDCVENAKSIPFTFEQINLIVNNILNTSTDWKIFFDEYFFNKYKKVDIVGFSIMGTSQLILSIALAKLIKNKWKGTIVIAGGTHITAKRMELSKDIRYRNYFDYYIPFHSEHTFSKCIQSIKNIEQIEGVIVPGKSSHFANQKLLNIYPFFVDKNDLIDYDEEKCTIPLQISEGCWKASCSMCTYNFIEKYHEIDFKEKLEQMLKFRTACKINRISFKDSNLRRENLLLIASELTPLKIHWNATTCIDDSMSEEDFKILRNAGCENLEIGVESIHPHIQKLINKEFPICVIENFIKKAINADISLIINLIFGFPSEQLDDAMKQLNWFHRIEKKYPSMIFPSFNMLEINQGSPMSKTPSKYGIELGELHPWAFSYPWNAPAWRKSFYHQIK